RRDPRLARRRGCLRCRARHERGHGLACRRTARALSSDRGRRRSTVALSPVLRLDGVSFSYGAVPALAAVSFAIEPGERVALVGRNGAGKSTLVRLVAGLERPHQGAVWVGDWDTRDCAPEQLARRIGSMFQHADQQLFASTVRDDVSFGPRALGLGEREVERRTDHALEDLDLTSHAAHHPYDLPPAFRKAGGRSYGWCAACDVRSRSSSAWSVRRSTSRSPNPSARGPKLTSSRTVEAKSC